MTRLYNNIYGSVCTIYKLVNRNYYNLQSIVKLQLPLIFVAVAFVAVAIKKPTKYRPRHLLKKQMGSPNSNKYELTQHRPVSN